jgi:predicted nucleic acid-binding Zn ribbon protein
MTNHDHSLKEVIEELLKVYRLDSKLEEVNLVNSWENVVGKMIANHTENIKVINRVLYVKVDSSALRHELHMERSKILKKLNKKVGKKVIDEIVLR